MDSAKYLARLGGLALALGVSAAAATSPGLASADASDAGSLSESADSTPAASPPHDPGANSADRLLVRGTDAETRATTTSDESTDLASAKVESRRTTPAGEVTAVIDTPSTAFEGMGQPPVDVGLPPDDVDAQIIEATVDQQSAPVRSATANRTDIRGAADGRDGIRASGLPVGDTYPAPEPAHVEPEAVATIAAGQEGESAFEGLPVSPVSAAAVAPLDGFSAPATSTRANTPSLPVATVGTPAAPQPQLRGLLAWAGLSPEAGTGPTVPAPSFFLVSALAWLRRELDHVFASHAPTQHSAATVQTEPFGRPVTSAGGQLNLPELFAPLLRLLVNTQPVAQPVQIVQDPNSSLAVGTLNALDPDGDAVTYTVSGQPAHGTVTLSPNGTFVYVAEDGYVGSDSFTVAVDDNQRSLFHVSPNGQLQLSLFGLLRPAPTAAPTSVSVIETMPQDPGDATMGFEVYNATHQPLTLVGYRADSGISPDNIQNLARPAPGTVIQPGESLHFETTFFVFKDNYVFPTFEGGDGTQYLVSLRVTSVYATAQAKCSASGTAACTPAAYYDANPYKNSTNVVLLDAPGTVIEIPASRGQAQSQILNKLCFDGSLAASCRFESSRQVKTFGVEHEIVSVANETSQEQSFDQRISDTVAQTDSLSVTGKAAVKIADIVNAEINTTYGHTWSSTHVFETTLHVKVPANTRATIYGQQPVNRVYGDFTLQMGNTKFITRDVYFDSPDPSGNGRYRISNGAVLTPPPSGA